MSRFIKIALIVTLLVIGLPVVFGINGCGKKSKSDKGTTAGGSSAIPSIVLVGEIGTGYNYAYTPSNLFEKFCHAFSNKAYAVDPSINKVIAIPFEGGYLGDYCVINRKEATINASGSFSLSLEKNMNWLLLLVDTTAIDPKNIFVGYVALNVNGSDGLLEIPATTAAGSTLDLGTLNNTGDTALSDNTSIAATDFAMTAGQLLSLAKNDELLKLVKNLFINYNFATGTYYTLRPDYKWRGDYDAISNTFYAPAAYQYISYQFQFDTNSTALTLDQIGGTSGTAKTLIELYPPTGAIVTTVNGTPVEFYTGSLPISNYNNGAALTKIQKADLTWEVQCPDFFASEMPEGGISYSLGSANLEGDIPPGYWNWVISGTLTGEFDVAVATPITATTKIKGFVPVIRANVAANNTITSIDVKWYTLNEAGTDYVEVTDITILKYLIGSRVDLYIENSYGGLRRYDNFQLDLTQNQTTVTPGYGAGWWYYGGNGPDEQRAWSFGIFYSAGGVGHFFEYFAPR